MVVNSSKESLVPRNSTSTLIRSQYWDWWRLPAWKVRNLKQKVCNIYTILYHPVPIQALTQKQEITQFPWLEILITQPWSLKSFFQNLSRRISSEKSGKKEARRERIKSANKDGDLPVSGIRHSGISYNTKQWSDWACSGIIHYRPLESVEVTHYAVKHLYH